MPTSKNPKNPSFCYTHESIFQNWTFLKMSNFEIVKKLL